MTSERGVTPKADDSTDRLRECQSDKGEGEGQDSSWSSVDMDSSTEGVQNTQNFADVICE